MSSGRKCDVLGSCSVIAWAGIARRCLLQLVFLMVAFSSPVLVYADADDQWVSTGKAELNHNYSGFGGFKGEVEAIAMGPAGSVYLGGDFNVVGDVAANGVAKWDPATESWEALGSGLNGTVLALASSADGSLYAGGVFTTAGGLSANRVAKWNPATQNWEALGTGLNDQVNALAIAADGTVYVGGRFTTAGGSSANRVAKWSPSTQTWDVLGSGISSWVEALTIASDGSVYVGGRFSTAGGLSVNGIAKWNPDTQTWAALGSGISGGTFSRVNALTTVADGSIYVGGDFTRAGGVGVNYIAKWIPVTQTWESMGGVYGSIDAVKALAGAADGSVYVGGGFTHAGGISASRIAKWNPATQAWQTLGSGVNADINALAIAGDGSVYAGGEFTTAGGGIANYVGRWDTSHSQWYRLGDDYGLSNWVRALATTDDGSVYVGGFFRSAGDVIANLIVKRNFATQSWEALGSGITSESGIEAVHALATAGDGSIYVGGKFTEAGGVSANHIAKWTPATQSWKALGSGLDNQVRALAVAADGSVYAGGLFSKAGDVSANGVAKWIPATQTWEALGPGVGTNVRALVVSADGSVYAGGLIANRVVKWTPDTQSWEALGSGPDRQVHALATAADGSIYVGGLFTSAGGVSANRVAKWNPAAQSWQALGLGFNTSVDALTVSADGSVYIGGVDGVSGDIVAKWDPATQNWETLGSGLNGSVEELATSVDGSVFVGGDFTIAGNKVSPYLAQWIPNNTPPLANAGADQTIEATSASGANTTLDASASSDDDGDDLTYSWSGPFGVETGVTADVSLPIGTSTITLEVSDGEDSHTDSVDITVEDSTAPIVSGPADVTFEATGATTPLTAVQLGTATATDTVDGSLTAVPDDLGPYPLGTTIVTWSATDNAGNTGSATHTVTITNDGSPVVTAPSDVSADATGATTSVDLGEATALDAVDGTLTATADQTGPYPVGITVVTWSATDSVGNTGTATQLVTVTDNGLPVVIAPPNISIEASGELTGVSLGSASATDAVDGTLQASADNLGPYPVGATLVTWSATDSAGNIGTTTQLVSILEAASGDGKESSQGAMSPLTYISLGVMVMFARRRNKPPSDAAASMGQGS